MTGKRIKAEPPSTAAVPGKSISADLRIIVRAVGGTASPGSFELTGKHVIGTAPDCDIVIRDRTVSRQHVELARSSEGIIVRDLESRNGTFYLDQRIKEVVLIPGARIRVGQSTIVLDVDNDALQTGLRYSGGDELGTMIGHSRAMHRLFALLERLRTTTLPVLIQGESGSGKEEVARTLHAHSQVAAGPLVTLNCGAFPRELVTSELFGHRRGAFTGAHETRKGAFESADGGTLFLDEIGELPLDVQPLLLRAIETGELQRVGDDVPRRVRVRLVTATHCDLDADVRGGMFREDLFYRIAVIRVAVPPLRERIDDIAPLANRFARAAGLGHDLSAEIIEELKARSWPGNVRELRNAVASHVAVGFFPAQRASKSVSLDEALHSAIELDRPFAEQKTAIVDRFTKLYLERLLVDVGGNRAAAAKRAGIDRSYLFELLDKHGLGKPKK